MSGQLKRIIRKRDLSHMLGVSVSTIDRMLNKGELVRPFRISAQAVGWDEAEILEWIEARKAARAH